MIEEYTFYTEDGGRMKSRDPLYPTPKLRWVMDDGERRLQQLHLTNEMHLPRWMDVPDLEVF